MRAMRSRMVLVLVLAAIAGVAALLSIDAPARAPSAQAQQFGYPDNFSSKDAWWPDEVTGTDTFPLTRAYNTADATLEPGESAPCAAIGHTLWFSWHADRPGTLDLDTNGSGFATVLAVYTYDFDGNITPSPPGAQLAPVACSADNDGERARLSIEVTPGREYLVQVGGVDGASGDMRLNATCACPPPNDRIGTPGYLYLDAYEPVSVSTVNTERAGIDPGEPTSCGNMTRTVWYSLSLGAATQTVVLDAFESEIWAGVAIYEHIEPSGGSYPSYGGLRQLGCGFDIPLIHTLDNTREYWIQVGGLEDAAGEVTLRVQCSPACPPYNDSIGTYDYWEPPASTYNRVNTEGATLEAGEPQPCGDIGKTVWYQVTARGDTTLTVETSLANFTSALAAYEVVGLSPPPAQWDRLGCETAASASESARIEFPIRANQPYYVQVGGVNGAGGTLDVSFSCDPEPCPPHNDSVHYPEFVPALLPFSVEIFGDTRGATTEASEPADCGDMGRSVWYSLEVYETWSPVPLLYGTEGSTFDTAIAVYELPIYQPADFATMQPIACDGGGAGERASVAWTAMPSKRYLVQVGGRGGASGDLVLQAACNPFCPPENDNQAASWYLGPGYVQSVDVRGATIEAGEPSPQCGAMDHTVWYRIEPAVAGASTWRINTAGSSFAPQIAVYTIEGLSPPGGGLSSLAASCGGSLTFETTRDHAYYIQVGALMGKPGGQLELHAECSGQCGTDGVVGPDNPGTGGGGGAASGGVNPPDTGSGGYLPGARRP